MKHGFTNLGLAGDNIVSDGKGVSSNHSGSITNGNGVIGAGYLSSGSFTLKGGLINDQTNKSICFFVYLNDRNVACHIIKNIVEIGTSIEVKLSNGSALLVGGSIGTGKWIHCAVCMNGNKIYVYHDGVLSGEKTIEDGVYSSNFSGIVGDNAERHFINDLRIYDHCLSAKEVKEISQGLVAHYKMDSADELLNDDSGYGNHLLKKNGTISYSNNSKRYSGSMDIYMDFDGSALSSYSYAPVNPTGQKTVSLWVKTVTSDISRFIEAGGICIGPYTGGGYFGYGSGTSITKTNVAIDTLWHHHVLTFTDNTLKYYIDGIQQATKTSVTLSSTKSVININGRGKTNRQMNDVRLYSTALSAEDVKALYEESASVDKDGFFHAREVSVGTTATPTTSEKVKTMMVKKNGVSDISQLWQTKNVGGMGWKIETSVDNSVFIPIYRFRPYNSAKCLFAKTDPVKTDFKYVGSGTWSDLWLLNYVDKWELMLMQKSNASSAAEWYRWVQPENPLTATFDSVSSNNVVYNSNYKSVRSGYGGLYCKNGSKGLLVASYSSTTTWSGVIVPYTGSGLAEDNASSTTGDGYPGWNKTNLKGDSSTEIAIYLRIDNVNFKQFPVGMRGEGDGYLQCRGLIEY